VRSELAAELELRDPGQSWHTSRQQFASLVSQLAIAAALCGQIANEIVNLQRTEIGELAEGAAPGAGGSSTMPQKRNPMLAQNVVALARLMATKPAAAIEATMHEHERDMAAWTMEWAVIPESFVLTHAALDQTVRLVENVVVNEDRIAANLAITGGLICAEAVMMDLASDMGRNEAHHVVKDIIARLAPGTSFADALVAHPKVGKLRTPEQINALLDPANYTGEATRWLTASWRNWDNRRVRQGTPPCKNPPPANRCAAIAWQTRPAMRAAAQDAARHGWCPTRACTSCPSPISTAMPSTRRLKSATTPALADKPVIIGGGTRGVVSTACYVARIRGVKSAMPMFKALDACPDAVVIKPDMAKYSDVGRQVRSLMQELTPLVEPLSIDEAFLDLSGTARLHGMSPARALAKLIGRIETEIGISASVGLSHTKYLAKLASDMDKPRGFFVLGPDECVEFLRDKPVSFIWGVGKAMQDKLNGDGIRLIGQLQTMEKNDLMRRYGSMGARLYHLSRGEDARSVSSRQESKSISAETTFNTDISSYDELERILWKLSEKVSRRAKKEAWPG
jgi:nucleotidyltransferase/DNA polymerase involved in DNA repair